MTVRRGDRLGVGLPLYCDLEYLELARELIEDEADFYELSPETLWRSRPEGLVRNDYHELFSKIRDRSGRPFVAHGLAFSPGSPLEGAGERARTEAWLERLRDDHDTFRFQWMTEHLGWTQVDGLQATLPIPLPFHDESVRAVSERMRLLRSVVPDVGFENNADYFCLGDPAEWPGFINRLCRESECGLLLDLHNLYTQCLNFKQDPGETLERLEADAVLQIHLSGGSQSDPEWLPSRRSFRLDSHDGPVPEAVWALYERAVPRCRNLRGVLLERLNGTFRADDVPGLRDELRRAREIFSC
jgi:uncharacterized protein (UPF0276 family)